MLFLRTFIFFVSLNFFCIFSINEASTHNFKFQKTDTWSSLQGHLSFVQDTERSFDFNEIQEKNFNNNIDLSGRSHILERGKGAYWYRFKLDKLISNHYLILDFFNQDDVEIFIPSYNGYEFEVLGTLRHTSGKVKTISDKNIIKIKTDSIDISQHFYFRINPRTAWAKAGPFFSPRIMITSDASILELDLLNEIIETKNNLFYLGIIFISAILFMVAYFITNDKSFFIYFLYLTLVTIYYSNRLPYFLEFYNKTYPSLYYYVNQITHILSMGLYLYFIYYFLDFEANFKQLKKFAQFIISSCILFVFIYSIQMFFFPYFVYRNFLMDGFRVLFTISSLILLFLILFRKPDRLTGTILIGSFILLLGNVFALILKDYTVFLKVCGIQIIIFSGLVSYNNKKQEKANTLTRLLLKSEKLKKQSLVQLNEAKSHLFQNISHELKTPLTLIKSPIERSVQKKESLSSHRLGLVYQNVNDLHRLIEDILALSRLSSAQYTLVKKLGNPIIEIESIISNFSLQASDLNIHLTLEINCKRFRAIYDPNILERIVRNLVSNSIKYSKSGDQILVEIDRGDDCLLVTVTDTGPGIALAEQEKVFQRFYRSPQNESKVSGTGLGLALVKEMVILHGGKINLTSEIGKGTCFEVQLPLEQVMPIEIQRENKYGFENADANLPPIIKECVDLTILVIEDHRDMREYLEEILKTKHKILTAPNGKKGIKLAKDIGPDLIITDWMMPNLNGISVCNIIKSNVLTCHIPIIILTARNEMEDKIISYKSGVDAFISKPFNFFELESLIQNLVQQRRLLFSKYLRNNQDGNKVNNIHENELSFWKKLVEIVRLNISNPEFNTSILASNIGISRMHLHRKLKQLTGSSASEFIRKERLRLSIRLIQESTFDISEVAYKVGYSELSSFSRAFKKEFGKNPSEYKSI